MAIRFSFEDNFIGRIYGASFGTKKLISNPPPPVPKNSRGPMQPTPNLISKTLLLGSIGFMFTSDKVNLHVLRSALQVSMRLLDLTLILVFW